MTTNSIDAYVAMLERSEREEYSYGFFGIFLLIMRFMASGIGDNDA